MCDKYGNPHIAVMVEEIMNKAGFDTNGVCINDYYDDRIYMTVADAHKDYYIHFDLEGNRIDYTLYKDFGNRSEKVGFGEYYMPHLV